MDKYKKYIEENWKVILAISPIAIALMFWIKSVLILLVPFAGMYFMQMMNNKKDK